ncbi:MAG: rhomboid family intramembrane serine protease, partial [Bacilli bacterium]
MPSIQIGKNDQIMMSLVHYFVTKENYTPINVQGSKDEIWLENLDGPYRVIRISMNTLINDEQYNFDIAKMRFIIKQIKKKTLSFKVNALNICLNASEKLDLLSNYNIDSIKLESLNEIKDNHDLVEIFPNIKDELISSKNGVDLIVNVTKDINDKTEKSNKQFSKIFAPKKIFITKSLIVVCIIMFTLMYIFGNGSTDTLTLLNFGANYGPLVKAGEIWRLLTCAFLHIGLTHLIVNMYSLYVIGNQVENFIGKIKFLIIFIVSAISGSLFSIIGGTSVSAGASGAIFGLLGALLYFGYHYRLYLGEVLKRQIIPIIILNLIIGFVVPGIDISAHIGGLIGGYLITMALGLEGKSTKKDMLNGSIVLILYIAFLS